MNCQSSVKFHPYWDKTSSICMKNCKGFIDGTTVNHVRRCPFLFSNFVRKFQLRNNNGSDNTLLIRLKFRDWQFEHMFEVRDCSCQTDFLFVNNQNLLNEEKVAKASSSKKHTKIHPRCNWQNGFDLSTVLLHILRHIRSGELVRRQKQPPSGQIESLSLSDIQYRCERWLSTLHLQEL